jgi:uncharacterized iron-regulated membrane protein
MALWERWLRRPQSVWLRRALFQVHLWTGIGLGLYVFVVSVSGSAIVFSSEVYSHPWPGPRSVVVSGPRLTHDQISEAAQRAYPKYSVTYVWDADKKPSQSVDVWMELDGKRKERQFDPYTGKDLAPSTPFTITFLSWMGDLHKNLLSGDTGRTVNGLAAILVTLLSMTGIVIWWPGIQSWRKSLTLRRTGSWKRLNWDLHSAVGFWTVAFVFMWGVTGVFVVFPKPFERAIDRFAPLDRYRLEIGSSQPTPLLGDSRASLVLVSQVAGGAQVQTPRRRAQPRLSGGDKIVRWVYYLHFGNFSGWRVKALWVLLGLAPPFLFVTGTLMWWNRVLSPSARRKTVQQPRMTAAEVSSD